MIGGGSPQPVCSWGWGRLVGAPLLGARSSGDNKAPSPPPPEKLHGEGIWLQAPALQEMFQAMSIPGEAQLLEALGWKLSTWDGQDQDFGNWGGGCKWGPTPQSAGFCWTVAHCDSHLQTLLLNNLPPANIC